MKFVALSAVFGVAIGGLSAVTASATATGPLSQVGSVVNALSNVKFESVEKGTRRRLVEDGFEDYDPWENGTRVNYFEDDVWYLGTITNYFDGTYTVEWDEGESDFFVDFEQVDQMVADFEALETTDPADEFMYGEGTPVRMYFENDGGWWDGFIVEIRDGSYMVQWSDNSVETYPPGEEIDNGVAAAAAGTDTPSVADTATDAPTEGDFYEIGTDVYKYFGEDEGWWWGTISWYDQGSYTITWSDDSTEVYSDISEVAAMVTNAIEEEQPWESGTAVWMDFGEEGEWFGEILTYYDGEYTIRWSDNSIENYTEDEVDVMVADAASKIVAAQADASSRTAGGKFVLSILIIGMIVAVTAFVMKFVIKGSKPKTFDEAAEEYKDDPDQVPGVSHLPDVI